MIEKLFYQPTPKKEIWENCIVVLDTNILLHAYQWRGITTRKIIETMKILNKENRLKVPYHAVVEFTNKRPTLIQALIEKCNQEISKLSEPQNAINLFPVFEGQEHFHQTISIQKNYLDAIKSYRDELKNVRDKLQNLFEDDPVLREYEQILKNCITDTYNETQYSKLVEEAYQRFKKNIPPGYKDKTKSDNDCGDYIIWKSILNIGKELGKNVVFVSADVKSDWVYKDSNKKVLSARFELIQEFITFCGKSFCYLTPSELLAFVHSEISEDIKIDLNSHASNNENNTVITKTKHEIYKHIIFIVQNNLGVGKYQLVKLVADNYGLRKYDALSLIKDLIENDILFLSSNDALFVPKEYQINPNEL